MNKTFKNTKTGEIISINTSEDWEEVVEKDYEILEVELKNFVKSRVKFINNIFVSSTDTFISDECTLQRCLNNNCKIISVKRLSNGEIFTVGDKVKLPNGDIEIIKEIEVDGNYIELYYAPDTVVSNDGKNWFEKIQHVKPLFTTEDGVDIFEGDEVTPVNLVTLRMHASFTVKTGQSLSYGSYKHFSTKKAAENYIKCHKPCLSYNEVLNLLNDTITSRETVKKRLNLLIKTKLNE